MRKSLKLISTTMLAGIVLLDGAAAHADQQAAQEGSQEASMSVPGAVSPPASAPTDGAAAAGTTGEIVVTAQRRSERLSDVPASIMALSTKALQNANITSTPDLAKLTPGLAMESYGVFLQPALRGVSSQGANVGESSNVATYIDGVYQPQQIATLLELPDVSQVEVLKGPQGALYGQNATGGAILVNSFAPSFKPSGQLSASYGNYNDVNLRGYATGPLSDTVAVSLAAGYHDHEGYRTQVVTGQRDLGLDSKVFRGKVLFQPVPGVRITVTGYYSDRRDSSAYAGFAINNNSVGYALVPTAPVVTSPSQFAADANVDTRIKSSGGNFRAEIDTPIGTITNVTSYQYNKASYIADADYSPVQYAQAYTPDLNGHYVISDTNLSSRKFGIAQFLVGFFYLNGAENFADNGFQLFAPSLPPAPAVTIYNLATFQRIAKQDIAGYGELTLQPTDKLFLTGGGRYTQEKQRGYSDFAGPTVLDYPGNPLTFSEFTPRATARYEFNPGANVYASWSKGFKSGGINLSDYNTAPFKPEKLTAYEVGFKGRPFDTVRFNAAAFLYNYKDIQIVQYDPPAYLEENAAAALIKGFDFDLAWNVTHEFTLSGGGAYLSSHYKNASATVYEANGAGDTPVPNVNISGNQLIRAPKFTGNVAANYAITTSPGRIEAYTALSYNSGYPMEVSGRIRQGAYATLDANLSFSPAAYPGVRLVAWGKNLTNKAYLASLLQSAFADGASYAEPRTYGVRAEFKF